VELLVVIGVIAILLTILAPYMGSARQQMYRTTCQNNLREIARGVFSYTNATEWHRGSGTSAGALPSITTRAGTTPLPAGAPWNASTNWADMKNGNAGCLWLLVSGRTPDYTGNPYEAKASWVAPKLFLCPEAESRRDFRTPRTEDGQFFPNAGNPTTFTCSYSFFSMVTTLDSNDPTIASVLPSTVIVADQNPRCTPGTQGIDANTNAQTRNSKNHKGDGQNAANMGQSVQWIESPSALGNNIYACDRDPNVTTPVTQLEAEGKRGGLNDSFLIP
jgi:type II secretory pathway pseudopilin PulG